MPTNDYSKNIVYLSKEQYQELIINETLTVNGQTITYNDNDIYVTPQAEPVTDVQVNGTSVITNGVANVPMASNANAGVAKVDSNSLGVGIGSSGYLYVSKADDAIAKAGTNNYKVIVPSNQHTSVYYGLAKAAGADMANLSGETVGVYPEAQKAAIQNMLGITDLISTEESSTATAAHALNSTFMMNGKLHRATAAIAIGDAVEVGTNCEVVKADEVFVKKTDYATNTTSGVVKIQASEGISMYENGIIFVNMANNNELKNGTSYTKPVVPRNQHTSIYYGLSKLAGVDLASETVTVGTYPEASKAAIRTLIGAGTPLDVQINGTSIVSSGVANILVSTDSGLGITSGSLYISTAGAAQIKAGSTTASVLKPNRQHEAVFYGLTKAAGVDMSSSSNAVGTYTDAAKVAIRAMLGATSSNVIAVQDEQPTDPDTKVWLPETESTGIEVPTYAEFQALDAAVVKKTDYAYQDVAGIVRVNKDGAMGLKITTENSTGEMRIAKADSTNIKNGTVQYKPIVPYNQHEAVFFGLSKAAGVDLASETVTVGTYPATASAAIRSMLGVVGDVQVNGTSIVNNGIANIPFGSSSVKGVVGASSTDGVAISRQGALYISKATDDHVKAGTHQYRPVVPYNQHIATFYGLAKAAGDTTMASSSNAVGTYTTEAKAAIRSMLGVETGISLIETVSGTTPSIIGQPNVKYMCGEVSTLSITPPVQGTIDVIFTSGSTATVLTIPNTVMLPKWFDTNSLDINTIYEIMITDGIYGSVVAWEQ